MQSVASDEWDRQLRRQRDGRAMVERRGGVKLEKYVGGWERCPQGGRAACQGRVCMGLLDGSIAVQRRLTLAQEQTLG